MKPPRYNGDPTPWDFVMALLMTLAFILGFIVLSMSLGGCAGSPAETEWSRANTEFVRQSGANMALHFQTLRQP